MQKWTGVLIVTDNEIIKALEICLGNMDCPNCPYVDLIDDLYCDDKLLKDILDLINRQKTEIDILIRKKESLRDEIAECRAEIERLKEIEWMYNDLCR